MGRIRALIVDYNASVRENLKSILENKDIEVIDEAEDGLEAEQKILSLEPDIVLLDLILPKLDGIGVVRRIKEAMQM